MNQTESLYDSMDTEPVGTSHRPVVLDLEEESNEDTRAPKRLCQTASSACGGLIELLTDRLSLILDSGDILTMKTLRKTIE